MSLEKYSALVVIGLFLAACSPKENAVGEAASYLAPIMNNPDAGAQSIYADFRAITNAQEQDIKRLEASGEYEKSRAIILSVLATEAARHTNAANYMPAISEAATRCEQTNGDGYWVGSLLVGLSDFCSGVGHLVGLRMEKRDYPGEF